MNRFHINSIHKRQAGRVLCVLLTLVLLVTAVFPAPVSAAGSLSAIDGTAAILVDASTGKVLYEQNADQPIAPASTTKIMTALLVVEAIERGKISEEDMVELTDAIMVNVPSDASRVDNAMTVGEQVCVRELLLMALMESDCVACDMLAVHVSGSVEAFVNQMNQRAQQLGCRDTNFVNSHGYPAEGHTATARSLYLITAAAAKYDLFMEAFSCLKYSMPATNKAKERTLYSTDKLLYDPDIVTSTYTVYFRDYVTGGKTGYSRASGNCLVSTASKNGLDLISVVTGVEMKYPDTQTVLDAFTETDRMLCWGFDNFSSHIIVNAGQVIRQVEVERGEPELIDAVCEDTVRVTLEKGVSVEAVQVTTTLSTEEIPAPVSAGDALGTVSLVMEGKVLASTRLLAGADSAARKKAEPNVPLIIILSVMVAAGAAFLLYYTNNNKILLLDLAKGVAPAKNSAVIKQPARKQITKTGPAAERTAKPERKELSDDEDYDFDDFFANKGKQ